MTVLEVDLTHSLDATDRCDSCHAQAYVSVAMRGTTLLFCAHCYRKHEFALADQGAVLQYDSRELLTQSPVGAY